MMSSPDRDVLADVEVHGVAWRTQAIVTRFPGVERSDNPLCCYPLVRREIVAQVARVVDHGGQSATMVAMRPDPHECEALVAIGHPYFSRGPWDERLGRIAIPIEAPTDWDEIAELMTDTLSAVGAQGACRPGRCSGPPDGQRITRRLDIGNRARRD
jgi:hypothetical protein